VPLFDPQTSGGLLIALAPEDARRFLAQAGERGIFAAQIGEVLPMQAHPIDIV
jgi:selenide,water dikinase